jgi:hypothetical protein
MNSHSVGFLGNREMSRPRILFVTWVYHGGERVYPVIEPLLEHADVDVLALDRMDPKYIWQGDKDQRPKFYSLCNRLGVKLFHDRQHDPSPYDLLWFDDSYHKKNKNLVGFYIRWVRKLRAKTTASPHGLGWHFDKGPFLSVTHQPKHWDHNFLFGQTEFDVVARNRPGTRGYRNLAGGPPLGLRDNVTLGGIPSNDRLAYLKLPPPEYILVLAGWLPSSPLIRGRMFLINEYEGYKILNGEALVKAGINELSRQLNLPVLISQKTRKYQDKDDFSLWKGVNNFQMINDHLDHDDLISKAAVVVGAPTTLAIKSLILGIPTILLRWYGISGLLGTYPGLVDLERDIFLKVYNQQKGEEHLIKEFAYRVSEGSRDGTATRIYVDKLVELAS